MTQEVKYTPKLTGSDSEGWNINDGISSGNGNSPQAALDAFAEDKALNNGVYKDEYWKGCAERSAGRCLILTEQRNELLEALQSLYTHYEDNPIKPSHFDNSDDFVNALELRNEKLDMALEVIKKAKGLE